MTDKHTPGPWVEQHDERGYAEWEIEAGDVNVGSIHRMSDARLIAAAPELLEALNELLDAYSFYFQSGNPWGDKARAAIAKATGGTQ